MPISRLQLFTSLWIAVVGAGMGPTALLSAQAQAQAEEQPKAYRAAVDEAVSEFEAGNFEEARSLFSKAHAVYPNARSLRGLGITEFELRNYGECIRYLQESLTSTVRPLEGDLLKDTEELLARAKGFVARLALEVSPGVASVLVDGVPVEVAEGGTLILQVGDHTIEVQAERFKPERRHVSVKGGEEQKLTIVLKQELAPRPPPLNPSRPFHKSPWLWTAVGVVVAGAAVGTAMALSGGETKTQTAEPFAGSSGAPPLSAP